jgi:hypothetical protein
VVQSPPGQIPGHLVRHDDPTQHTHQPPSSHAQLARGFFHTPHSRSTNHLARIYNRDPTSSSDIRSSYPTTYNISTPTTIMAHLEKPLRHHADPETSTMTNEHHAAGSPNDYRYDGSAGSVARFITPGGNPIDNSQPAFPGEFAGRRPTLALENLQPDPRIAPQSTTESSPTLLPSVSCHSRPPPLSSPCSTSPLEA